MNFVDDLLRIEDKTGLTPLADINGEVRTAGQQLINHFVRVQGLAVSQVSRATGRGELAVGVGAVGVWGLRRRVFVCRGDVVST